MAINFQYNKTFLHQLNKGLKVRETALPTLIAKESALRNEVRKARMEAFGIEQLLLGMVSEIASTDRLWAEFSDDLLRIKNVNITAKKIAGVNTPVFNDVEFSIADFSVFLSSAWVPSGVELLKKQLSLTIQFQIAAKKVEILEFARKKTTQKVNLYEKVQIPEYKEAIRKIKRYLEDEENLSKSSQKILKAKIAAAVEV